MRSIQYNAVPLFVAIAGLVALSQVVPNRGLTPADLDLARTLTTEVSGAAGGVTAELVYAHRFDPVTRGQFDSLLVLYSRRSDQGPAEYFAFVHRNGERLILALDSRGHALQPGDLFLRIGLRRLPDQPPILRVVGSFDDPVLGPSQRNVDFQFKGTDFILVGQSVSRLPAPPRN